MTRNHSTENTAANVALRLVNVAALLAGVSILTDFDVARTLAAVVLFVLGPGSGLVLAIRHLDPVFRWAMTPALSIAAALVVSQLVMSIDRLTFTPVVAILTALTAVGLVATTLEFALNRKASQR